jgi:hypothetical protein
VEYRENKNQYWVAIKKDHQMSSELLNVAFVSRRDKKINEDKKPKREEIED